MERQKHVHQQRQRGRGCRYLHNIPPSFKHRRKRYFPANINRDIVISAVNMGAPCPRAEKYDFAPREVPVNDRDTLGFGVDH